MKIRLVRTGGVAGMRREVTVDTDSVGAERAGQLRSLLESVRRAGLFQASSAARGRARDCFRYRLTVEDERGRREATFTEEAAPRIALRLVETIWKASESAPPKDLRTV